MFQRKGYSSLILCSCCIVLSFFLMLFLFLSFTGTVIGIGDISSQWPGSKWRSLKVTHELLFIHPNCMNIVSEVYYFQVHWDEASSIQKPEKISPWDVEPFSQPISASGDPQAAFSKKRARSPLDLPGTGSENEVIPFHFICSIFM